MNIEKGILSFLCILLIILSSCTHSILEPTSIVESNKNIEINTDVSDLSTSISFHSDSEMPVYDFRFDTNHELQEPASNTFLFVKCASISSGGWQGLPFRFTDIKVCGDYAMVCGQSESTMATVFTLIDLVNPKVPTIVSQAYLPHRYANYFDFNDDVLIIEETVDTNYFENFKSNLVIERFELKNFMFTPNNALVESEFGSVNNIISLKNDVYLASTENNSVQILDASTLETRQHVSLEHVQTINQCLNQISAMQIDPFRFTILDPQNEGCYHTTLLNGPSINMQSNAFAVYEDIVAIVYQECGVQVYNTSNGKLTQLIEPVELSPSVVPKQYQTQNAAMDQDFLYTANGLGGCAVFQKCMYPDEKFERMGYLDFDSSVEQVQSNGHALLVLCKNNTIQIIEKERVIPEPANYDLLTDFNKWGVPESVQSHPSSGAYALVEKMNQFLPESISILTYHCNLTTQSIPTLTIERNAEVTLTFLKESTGWKNSIGYYSYPSNIKPVQLSQILNMKIIFPNASLKGYGGGLLTGDSISLGQLDAGSELGFFMIAQGWNNGQITYGASQFLTNYQLTDSQFPNHLFLYDPIHHAIILTFEEMDRRLETCDHDFNDVVLSIEVHPESAINTTLLPQIVL